MSKKILIFSLLLVGAGIIIIGGIYYFTRPAKVTYQYDKITSGTVAETVNVNGVVKAAQSIDLSFQVSGKINQKYVSVNDQVKTGQALLSLDNSDQAVQLASAQAALDKQLAGNRPEYIAQLQAAVNQAKASLDQVSAVSANNIHAAQDAQLNAQNNLKLAQGGETSQIVEDAYENMTVALQGTQNSLANALTKADNILGIDNTQANEAFKDLLSVRNPSALNTANAKYALAKTKQQAFFQVNNLLVSTNHPAVDLASASAEQSLSATQDLLNSVATVLDNTITSVDLSVSELDGLKTTIQLARTDLASNSTGLTNQKHAIATAKNSYITYQIAATKADQDLADIKNKSSADIASAKATLDKAKAALADAQNPPRAVDLESYRTAVEAAQLNYNKTILTAPFDGKVSQQDGELGTLAIPNVPLVSIISNNKYQIESFVAETDLAKIQVGDSAMISLDTLDGSTQFSAKVIKIDPSATQLADGSSAYKVTLQFDNEDPRLKVGLSANIKIYGAKKDNVLIILAHDVVQKNGLYYAMVLNSQQKVEEKQIELGLKGGNDQWELISGLAAGDSVVSFSSN